MNEVEEKKQFVFFFFAYEFKKKTVRILFFWMNRFQLYAPTNTRQFGFWKKREKLHYIFLHHSHTPTFSPFSGYCGQINVIYIKLYPCIPIFYYYYFFLKISFPLISPFFSSFVVPPQFSFAASLSNIFRLMIFYLQPPQSPLVLFEWTWFI